MSDAEYRVALRNGHCRVCDDVVKRGIDKDVYFYSWRNRGQNIIICPKCVQTLNTLLGDDDE